MGRSKKVKRAVKKSVKRRTKLAPKSARTKMRGVRKTVRTVAQVEAGGSAGASPSRSKSARAKTRAPENGGPNGVVHWLTVVGARQNNLKNIDVAIPLRRFVAVTGVSGSGKSSLVNDILREALARDLNGAENVSPGDHDRIDGIDHLDKVIDIDQSPIGRTPRSNPATYIKVFDEIRSLYTKLPDAKVRGYKPGRFSFNVPTGVKGGGRCEACEGNGSNRMEMEFLADVWVTCPVCNGHRFSRETLQILYKGKSIADVLEMDVQEALDHFTPVPKIANMLKTLHDVGLDYVKLGQSSTTLSGGEAQRIKLARELVKKSTGRTLYILDEPTTGLHFADIKRLLAVLHGFVDAGNTVVVIEHNLDVIKTADWVIDLGPEGGVDGGRIMAEGTPEDIAGVVGSHTGQALCEVLNGETSKRRNAETSKRQNEQHLRSSIADLRLEKGTNGRRIPSRKSLGSVPKSPIANRKSQIENVISVVGARQNNLKGVTVAIPRGKTTICTGPSGSGKSSFAIETVYAEGQRRYVESLSSYARQFLGRLQPPKVDHIYGLSPSISIEQRNTSKSPRSTVGTITEIYDYMRVLWARIGVPHCPKCRVAVGSQSAEEIVERLLNLEEGTRLLLLAPVEPAAGESYDQLFQRERANGFARARIDGVVHSLEEPITVRAKRRHKIELVVDRVVIKKSGRSRLTDSVEQALAVGQGVMIAQLNPEPGEPRTSVRADDSGEDEAPAEPNVRDQSSTKRQTKEKLKDLRFSQHSSCPSCGRGFAELTPHHFSFNSRLGWCEACEGLGTQQGASPAAIVVHPTRSIVGGALSGWDFAAPGSMLHHFASALANHLGFDPDTPWNELTDPQQQAILHGCGDAWIGPDGGVRFKWRGFFPAIARATRVSWQYRKRLEDLATEVDCESCGGGRLAPEPAQVRVGDARMHEVCRMPLGTSLTWFDGLKLPAREQKIAGELLHEIRSRLRFLVDVGLDYVSLHRSAATLSGGESQRIQLASQIGTGLTGVLYVLDEPTIGLHPRDNDRLIKALKRLRDLGNTLLVVEHDREMIESSDHVLNFGPGAGTFGGEVTATGTPKAIRSKRTSLTGKYLSNRETIAVPTNRRPVPITEPRTDLETDDENGTQDTDVESSARPRGGNPVKWLTVHAARENNLKEIDVSFPLGRFTCVTGVSGSGKSSLVSSVLYNALAVRIHRARLVAGGHERITGLEHIDKVINVDQSPIGNTPTSNPATYTGVFDSIRELFAKLPMSKIRGYGPNRFSFNRPGGRCEPCQGMGRRCIEMHFLPDVWVECETCGGRRFTTETLEVQYRGKSIADVLAMRISECLTLFANVPRVRRMLETLDDVGLGYLELGQSATTLSGGEAQRVKLAAELGRPSTGKTLYILDEPTTGLHFDDLKKLIAVLQRLVDLGNAVLCIEHNLDVIKSADWVIDLGPEAGEAGGYVVAAGTPERIVRVRDSRTGQVLKPILERGPHLPRKPFDQAQQRKLERARSARIDLGDDVKMPWQIDGKSWHTVDHLDREGKPVAWSADALLWIVETIEGIGGFAPTDWNDRSRIEIQAPKAAMWFVHIRTGGQDLFEVALRVPRGAFADAALRRKLKLKTLDERDDLPIYGQASRVRMRRHSPEWDEITLLLRDFADIKKTTYRSFLTEAARAYFDGLDAPALSHKDEESAAKDHQARHMGQRAVNRRRAIAWEPVTLMTLIGRLRSLDPGLRLDWSGKTAVQFSRSGEDQPAGKIVTNMARGLRVELRAPSGEITPVQVDRLGEDGEIKRHPCYDRVVFWIKDISQIDPAQLRSVWTLCGSANKTERLQSA